MNRGVAISNRRIIPRIVKVRTPAAPAPVAPRRENREETPQGAGELSTRPAAAADLPWLQTWAAQLGLPAPRARQVQSIILLRDGQRAGYMAIKNDMVETERGREPILWIVSAFLIPSLRGQGLILKYGEILSKQYYHKGKVGCRVAAVNTPMMRLMARGGWKKLHATRQYTDFVMELDGPFRATRRS
jgi:hypothetical protein